jgi:hypothetical protein
MAKKEAKKEEQVVEAVKIPKKVAIVGCSESKSLAPFDDESFEIWGVNNLYMLIPRATRWFEIHQITQNGKNYLRRGSLDFRGQKVDEYLEQLGIWTKEKNCPVYMQQKWDIIPTSIIYPLQDITTKFGGYFTNTVSYMLALALHENFDEIHVYGVDMAVSGEYFHQRPSCEFFLGIAVGLGKKVYIPPEADLLKTRFLYGFHETEMTAWAKKCKMMKESMLKKRTKIEHQIKHSEAQFHQYLGAENAINELNKIWG